MIPNRLFKYKTLDSLDYVFDIISEKVLYHSSVDQFNDPMEFNFRLSFEKPLQEKIQFFADHPQYKISAKGDLPNKEEIKKFETNYSKADFMVPTKNKYGVFCFSNSHLNSSLWSYYAGDHKGVCIEFDTSKADRMKLAQVIYKTDELPIINFYDQGKFDETRAFELFITKQQNYLHEDEYRSLAGPKERCNFDQLGHVAKLYLGVNSEKHKNYPKLLKRLSQELPNLIIVPLHMSQTKYGLLESPETTAKKLWEKLATEIAI